MPPHDEAPHDGGADGLADTLIGMDWWEWMPGWLALLTSVAAIGFAATAHQRAGRAEVREKEALETAKRAVEISERAENRAELAESRSRVTFEYEDSEVVPGLYAGDVNIRVRHSGTVPVDVVQFDADRLQHWAVSNVSTLGPIAPGGRAEIQMSRDRFGELPDSLLLHWWIGEDQGEQEIPLPADLTRSPDPPSPLLEN